MSSQATVRFGLAAADDNLAGDAFPGISDGGTSIPGPRLRRVAKARTAKNPQAGASGCTFRR